MKPAVIYAAKSTEDKHGSLPTQLEDCRHAADREGWTVIGEFSDEAFSAYHGNRGPGLDRAKLTAIKAAAEHGWCVLVAQDVDRFARGAGDAPGAADHLGEMFFAMRRQRVELWSVRTGEVDSIRAVIEGERSNSESERKSQATKAGLRRRVVDRGQPNGGRSYGYRTERYLDADGDPKTRLVVHQGEAAIVRRIFNEYIGGRAQATMARDLESERVPTRTGGHWYASTVHSVLTNPMHAGKVKSGAETFPGRHEPIISREMWEGARQLREGRHTHGGRPRGRRTVGPHLLTEGLLLCVCGSPMTPETRRKNGRAYEVYRCARRKVHAGACSQKPIRREAVDQAVFRYFERVALDKDSAHTSFTAFAARELADAGTQTGAAERELAKADARLARIKRGWQDDVIDDAEYAEQRDELLAEKVAAEAQFEQHRHRREQIHQALAAIDIEKTLAAEMISLRKAVAGQVQDGNRSGLDPLRAVLRRLFAGFQMSCAKQWGVGIEGYVWQGWDEDDSLLGLGDGYWLLPVVRREAVAGWIDEGVGMPAIRRLALPFSPIYTQPTGDVTVP